MQNSLDKFLAQALRQFLPSAESLRGYPSAKLGRPVKLEGQVSEKAIALRVTKQGAAFQLYLEIPSDLSGKAGNRSFALSEAAAAEFLKRPQLPESSGQAEIEIPFLGREGEFESGFSSAQELWGVVKALGGLKSVVFASQADQNFGVYGLTHKNCAFQALATERFLDATGIERSDIQHRLSVPIGSLIWALHPRVVEGVASRRTNISVSWSDGFWYPKGVRVWQFAQESNWFFGANLFAKDLSEAESQILEKC